MKRILLFLLMLSIGQVYAQTPKPPYASSKFDQLDDKFPTPNMFRSGDGSPGPEYWQQKADYTIKIELFEQEQVLKGSETITYTNNSPQPLTYLWIQLDQNRFSKDSD
ncbi:MAG: M1 family peptidase, partial [Bacteroidota bacterium]